MSRIRTLFTIVVPSMLAGGLIFNSALGSAAGRDENFGFWPAASDVAAPTPPTPKAPPAPPAPPTPPTPRTAPTAPTPPTPPAKRGGAGGGGVSVSINNGKVQIDGLHDLVLGQIDAARESIKNNQAIPKDVRDKVGARLDKVRATVDKRLANLKITDMDQLESEMEKMGEEIEQSMEGLDKDLEKLGKGFGKNFGKNWGKNFNVNINGNDDDDDDDNIGAIDTPDVDADDDDMKDAIKDLRDMALKPDQKAKINKLRADSDKTVGTAKKQMDDLSQKLQTALGNPTVTDAEIGRLVDQISAQEATIRKSRIQAWAQARRELDEAQRKRVEDAAKKKTK
jgi:hypothetical protein